MKGGQSLKLSFVITHNSRVPASIFLMEKECADV